MPLDEAREHNLANWNERVPIHVASDMYDVKGLAADPDRIENVVRFDLPYLPHLDGARLVHLQCHIGTDTLSLARLGANVTGYDFSGPALEAARRLFDDAGVAGTFVEGELYDAPQVLGEGRFDVVYTGIGALCWLPDIAGWAEVVAALLAPGGALYLREAHPILWALDHERDDDLLVISEPYFETQEPMVWDEADTYADQRAPLENTRTYEWNHGIGEIIGALLSVGLTLEHYAEHRIVDWQPFGLFQRGEHGYWELPEHLRDRLPLTYSLRARAAG